MGGITDLLGSARNCIQRAKDILSAAIESMREMQYVVTSSSANVNVRSTAGIGDNIADQIPNGTTVLVPDPDNTISADGYTWVQVTYTDADGNVQTGWMAMEILDPVVTPPPEGALAISPISGASTSGWAYGSGEYKIPAGTTIGDTTYAYDTIISESAYNAIPEADRGEIVFVGMHPGIDISGSEPALSANTSGTVYMYQATPNGIVPYDPENPAESLTGFGNFVVLETEVNGETYYQVFAHMDGFDENLTQGQEVEAGTLLGDMGSTGNSTGDHVHWEVRTEDGLEIDEDGNVNISVWFPQNQTQLNTNFVSPDAFAGILEAQEEESEQ